MYRSSASLIALSNQIAGQVSLILIRQCWFLSTTHMYIAEAEQVFVEDDVSILDVSCMAK